MHIKPAAPDYCQWSVREKRGDPIKHSLRAEILPSAFYSETSVSSKKEGPSLTYSPADLQNLK